MGGKSADLFFTIGETLLYLFIALISILVLLEGASFYSAYADPQTRTSFDIGNAVIVLLYSLSPLVILLPAKFLARKHSTLVGGIILIVGVFISILLLENPIDPILWGGYATLIVCPAGILFFLIGVLFLFGGLSW